jgi:hypothetical protein
LQIQDSSKKVKKPASGNGLRVFCVEQGQKKYSCRTWARKRVRGYPLRQLPVNAGTPDAKSCSHPAIRANGTVEWSGRLRPPPLFFCHSLTTSQLSQPEPARQEPEWCLPGDMHSRETIPAQMQVWQRLLLQVDHQH